MSDSKSAREQADPPEPGKGRDTPVEGPDTSASNRADYPFKNRVEAVEAWLDELDNASRNLRGHLLGLKRDLEAPPP